MKVKIYGCRGSVPTSRHPASTYGGNTSCVYLKMSGQEILLDAGSGLVQFDNDVRENNLDVKYPLNILLSHLHLDHTIGLTVFAPVWNPDLGVKIYTPTRDERMLKQQIFGSFEPPYWPLSMVEAAYADCVPVEDRVPFKLGPLTITPFSATHPDDTYSFHITDGKQTVVHLLDSETTMLDKDGYERLVNYCTDADLVVFDAAYSPLDYIKKVGFGHSTVEDGFKLAEKSNCKRMLFSHFGYEYSDDDLKELDKTVKDRDEKYIFSREGMELEFP